MILINDIELIGKAVFIKKEKILVLADIHIGYEEALNAQGVLVPRTQFKETIEDLNKILSKISEINKVIILGDLKHEFGLISQQEWRETLKFLELLEARCSEIILIKGNHDTILGPIAAKKNIQIKESYKFKNYFFAHGNKQYLEMFDSSVQYIFLGHIHPAISLRENAKIEKYKCFLVGEYKNKKIIVLPSSIPMIEGFDTIQGNIKIFNKIPISNFDVYAIEDKVYFLGKHSEI